jgi:hypothetical protein
VEGKAGKRTFGLKKRWLAGIVQQEALLVPKRSSRGHALIEFVRRFRLDEGVANGSVFVEEDCSDVVGFPLPLRGALPGRLAAALLVRRTSALYLFTAMPYGHQMAALGREQSVTPAREKVR